MSIFDNILAVLGSTAANLLAAVSPAATSSGNAGVDAAAAGAAIQATAVNQQNFTISTQTTGTRKPTWVSKYPIADVSYPDALNFSLNLFGTTSAQSAGTAHTHGLNTGANMATSAGYSVPQNGSYGAYITITDPTVMDTFGLYVYRDSGSLNNVFLEVFKEDPVTTALTRLTSTNIAASIAGTPAYLEVALSSIVIVQPGERYLARIRNSTTVTGVLAVIAVSSSTLAPDVCFATTGASLTNQTSYTAAQVATAKVATGVTMWAMLASKATITATDQSFSDDFNRSSMGGLWVRYHTAGSSDLGITSNQTSYVGTTDGAQNALYIRSCVTNGNRVDCDVYGSDLATTGARLGSFLNANQDLSQMVFLGVTYNSIDIYTGPYTSLTSRATISSSSNDGKWSLIYDVGSNTYTAYKNGVAVGLSWTDSGNLMTHGDGYRFGGVRISRVSSVNAGTVDNWTLRDYS